MTFYDEPPKPPEAGFEGFVGERSRPDALNGSVGARHEVIPRTNQIIITAQSRRFRK
jgi:hypothetical protein